jgi:hypothetical protein
MTMIKLNNIASLLIKEIDPSLCSMCFLFGKTFYKFCSAKKFIKHGFALGLA